MNINGLFSKRPAPLAYTCIHSVYMYMHAIRIQAQNMCAYTHVYTCTTVHVYTIHVQRDKLLLILTQTSELSSIVAQNYSVVNKRFSVSPL